MEEISALIIPLAKSATVAPEMDKNNTKLPQSSTKGVPADSKKNQDATNNKVFPKNSRKYESAGTSNFPRHEQQRKSHNVQRAKNFDKRPKPKGHYHGGPKEDPKVGITDLAEPGSVVAQGSKKQNLNHLLNFHYEPRDVQAGSGMWMHGKGAKGYNRNSNRWLPPVQRHKYNKEQFLQASCQFVVTANGNYSLHLADPDVLVDWKFVEQIKVYSSDNLSCPICLCAPIAGKMTRCGHVYCWPCILHYLSLSDKTWRQCPICYESVHKSDLKSVVEITQSTLNSGDIITLRLMRREKGSLLAVPVGSSVESPTNFFSVSEEISKHAYSKLLIANAQDIMDIIECERVQLKVELMDNPDSPENCYIEQALNELSKRQNELLQKSDMGTMTTAITTSPINEIMSETATRMESVLAKEMPHISPEEHMYAYGNTTITKSFESQAPNLQSISGGAKFSYFYQADDGQHLYLHAMNVKMLEMQYGSLENSPHVITGKLLEKESGSLTDDLRRRLRYLCHLPLTCQFEIAEIELKPPTVSEGVLLSFHDKLALRQRHRERRERDERKREKKITEEENKQMGKYPIPEVHIDSQLDFPQWQPELLFADENVPSPPESAAPSSIAGSPPSTSFEEIVSETQQPETNQDNGPSFAEMLRNPGTRTKPNNAWPSLSYARSESNAADRSSSLESDTESYTMPSYSRSFGDALAHALEQTHLLNAETKRNGNGNGKKKKKKNKATVLFATTMANPF